MVTKFQILSTDSQGLRRLVVGISQEKLKVGLDPWIWRWLDVVRGDFLLDFFEINQLRVDVFDFDPFPLQSHVLHFLLHRVQQFYPLVGHQVLESEGCPRLLLQVAVVDFVFVLGLLLHHLRLGLEHVLLLLHFSISNIYY